MLDDCDSFLQAWKKRPSDPGIFVDFTRQHVGHLNDGPMLPVIWAWPHITERFSAGSLERSTERDSHVVDCSLLGAREIDVKHVPRDQPVWAREGKIDHTIADAIRTARLFDVLRRPCSLVDYTDMGFKRDMSDCRIECAMDSGRCMHMLEGECRIDSQ